jgi:hypothetical protein
VQLGAPAIELDLMQPLGAKRRGLRDRRGHRLNEWNSTQYTVDIVFCEMSAR